MRRPTPWSMWLVGWLAAIVLAGGIAEIVDRRTSTEVETTVRDVHVLPSGQAIVTGTVTALQGTDVVGPPVPMPIELAQGRATIEDALVDGRRAVVVWQGGRPFRMEGDGAIDLGPTSVSVDGAGAATWPLADGVWVLTQGRYTVRTPVAVGEAGLARPRDGADFLADGLTTIETSGVPAVTTKPGPLHFEGPGRLVLDGSFSVRTRDGRRRATHLEFGPGPLVVDLTPGPGGLAIRATLQGPLR